MRTTPIRRLAALATALTILAGASATPAAAHSAMKHHAKKHHHAMKHQSMKKK
jgi:hypothetical protein